MADAVMASLKMLRSAWRRWGRPMVRPVVVAKRDLQMSGQIRRERELLAHARSEAGGVAGEREPLVTVVIPTYNRASILVERTLPSVFAQTYQRLEVVIVGDHCPDDTAARVEALRDPRIRFHDLEHRGPYPHDPLRRWMVQSVSPMNKAFDLARGSWIAHLDDDDVFTPDHIEVLMRAGVDNNAELVYGISRREVLPGKWEDRGDPRFSLGICLPSACLYRSYLNCIRPDVGAWKLGLVWDKHRWRRMYKAGVRTAFISRVVTYSPLRPGTSRADFLAEDRN